MDYQIYRQKYFTDPPPQPRYSFSGVFGTTLYYQDYEAAVDYYQGVLGLPGYVEGDSTKGWQIGDTWLTLLRGADGNPSNVEVMIYLDNPQEADRLQQALIEAGGSGPEPVDTFMYEPVHVCPVQDPFGTDFMFVAPSG